MTSVSLFQLRRWFFFILGTFLVIGSGPAILGMYMWLQPSGLAQSGYALFLSAVLQSVLVIFALLAYRSGLRIAAPKFFFGNILFWASGFTGFLSVAMAPNLIGVLAYATGTILLIALAIMVMRQPRRAHFIGG